MKYKNVDLKDEESPYNGRKNMNIGANLEEVDV